MPITNGYPGIPKNLPDEADHRRKIAEMLNDRINRGKFNCTTSITLTPSVTTTTLIDERLGAGSFVWFMPVTAHASTALANIYVTNQGKGSCTINHASSANVDQTFTVLILG